MPSLVPFQLEIRQLLHLLSLYERQCCLSSFDDGYHIQSTLEIRNNGPKRREKFRWQRLRID